MRWGNVSELGQQVAAIWQDPQYAQAWMQADSLADILVFPRTIAAAMVAQERPEVGSVVDIGSGPGAFLAVFLDTFPAATGTWSDASEAMMAAARENLARFGDRVSFVLADMTDLAASGLPERADVVLTSRAAHHLDRPALMHFYAEAAQRLAPGGWLVNLDHTGPVDVWDKRYRALRPAFNKGGTSEPKHHHNYPLTSISDHLDAMSAAGLSDHDIAWRAFYTCLFMGRKEDSA